MPGITLTVRERIASAAPDGLINGNNDYIVTFDLDNEWSAYSSVQAVVVAHKESGDTRTETTLTGATLTLPAQQNTYALEIGVQATDGTNTIASTAAWLSCTRCITDGDSTETERPFDVYNAIMQYLVDRSPAELEAIEEHMTPPTPEPFPSAAYRLAAAAPVRQTRLRGVLTLPDETEIELTDSDVAGGSVSIVWEAMSDDYLLPGGVPSAELRLTLHTEEDPADLYSAEIALTYGIRLLTGAWYDFPLGVFTVAAVDDASDGLQLTAYDDMYQLDHIAFTDLGITTGTAYSPQEIIELVAEAAGIDYDGDVSEFINASRTFVLSDADASIQTARDLLMHTVQIIGALAYVDRNRKLKIVQLANADPVATLTAYQRKSLSLERTTYKTLQINTVADYPNEDGGVEVEARAYQTLWASGVTADLPENPLLTVVSATTEGRIGIIRQCFTAIKNALDPIVFHPATAETYGDPSVEPFEWRSFTRDGETFSAPVTASEWHYGGSHRLVACGKDAIAGIAESQAQKAALARRISAANVTDNIFRDLYIGLIQTTGHAGMAQRSHEWLAHYTHGELAGEED